MLLKTSSTTLEGSISRVVYGTAWWSEINRTLKRSWVCLLAWPYFKNLRKLKFKVARWSLVSIGQVPSAGQKVSGKYSCFLSSWKMELRIDKGMISWRCHHNHCDLRIKSKVNNQLPRILSFLSYRHNLAFSTDSLIVDTCPDKTLFSNLALPEKMLFFGHQFF